MYDENDAKERAQRRPLEEVTADITAIDEQIAELNKRRTQLVIEHDEAVGDRCPRPSRGPRLDMARNGNRCRTGEASLCS